MRRTPLERKAPLAPGAKSLARGSTFPPPTSKPRARRSGFTPASKDQRLKVMHAKCTVSDCPIMVCDPAHLIDRAMTGAGQEDPRAVVPLCRAHHTAYDQERLDLSADLELRARVELAFAVERVGLFTTLRRVTNTRWSPDA